MANSDPIYTKENSQRFFMFYWLMLGVSLLVASQLVLMKFSIYSIASFVTPTGERQENKFIVNQWNILKGQIVSLTCVPPSAFSQGCSIQKSADQSKYL